MQCFFCDQTDELIQWRTTFVLAMSARLPEILVVSTATAMAVLRSLVFNRNAVCQVAKFVHYVFGVFADRVIDATGQMFSQCLASRYDWPFQM
jgi:hydrogenase/urease accessory protein HupE